MKNLSERITQNLVKRGFADPRKKEILAYSIYCRILMLCNQLVLIFISLVSNCLTGYILFAYSFFSLRKYTGGYHASRVFYCFSFSVLIVLFLPFWNNFYLRHPIISNVSCFASIAVILICSPVNHPNVRLSKKEILFNKAKTFHRTSEYALLAILLVLLGVPEFIGYIFLGLIMTAILILAAKITGQEVKINDDKRYAQKQL